MVSADATYSDGDAWNDDEEREHGDSELEPAPGGHLTNVVLLVDVDGIEVGSEEGWVLLEGSQGGDSIETLLEDLDCLAQHVSCT